MVAISRYVLGLSISSSSLFHFQYSFVGKESIFGGQNNSIVRRVLALNVVNAGLIPDALYGPLSTSRTEVTHDFGESWVNPEHHFGMTKKKVYLFLDFLMTKICLIASLWYNLTWFSVSYKSVVKFRVLIKLRLDTLTRKRQRLYFTSIRMHTSG